MKGFKFRGGAKTMRFMLSKFEKIDGKKKNKEFAAKRLAENNLRLKDHPNDEYTKGQNFVLRSYLRYRK